MASISDDPNGRRRITFYESDGRQRVIRMGKCDKHTAQNVRIHVEALFTARTTGDAVAPTTARWLPTIGPGLHAKLANVDLVAPRKSEKPATLGDLFQSIFSTLAVKGSTVAAYTQARMSLEAYFGAEKALAGITPEDAAKWQQSLRDEKLATATVAKRTMNAKMLMRKAVKWKLLTESPFADLRPGSQVNKDRAVFVSRADIEKVIDQCPDDEWKAIVALSRYGGLRCPSEHLGLRWVDVLWDKDRIIIRSPKTAHHEGKDTRVMPLFPELRPILMRLFESAEPGAEHVITRHRKANCNLRTHLERIIGRAGLKSWPRLFHNLRASRQTELVEIHPAHVVSAWLGNSVAVATAHYLQVRDSDFEKAVGTPGMPGDNKASWNPSCATPESVGTDKKHPNGVSQKPHVLLVESALCGSVQSEKWAQQGSNL